MEYSCFHWTLTPWAIYGIAGLALAYATFRKGRGNRLSSAFSGLHKGVKWLSATNIVLAAAAPSTRPPGSSSPGAC